MILFFVLVSVWQRFVLLIWFYCTLCILFVCCTLNFSTSVFKHLDMRAKGRIRYIVMYIIKVIKYIICNAFDIYLEAAKVEVEGHYL